MYVLLLVLLSHVAMAQQPSAIVDDLESRAIAALNGIRHPGTQAEVETQRGSLRSKLEESLRVRGLEKVDPIKAFLYLPESVSGPAPAIVILHPHEDPATDDAAIVPASLARLGFVVLSLDVRDHHGKLDLLVDGTTPQALIQHDVRAALAYLATLTNVDPKRIGFMGSQFAGTIAAAMNPEFAAVVLTDALPDLRETLKRMRTLPPTESPDACELVPGLFQFAATEELLAMMAPRPILAIKPAPKSFDYAAELYRAFEAHGRLSELADSGSAQVTRYAVYRWFAQRLQDQSDIGAFVEPAAPSARSDVQLVLSQAATPSQTAVLSESTLDALLGAPLPAPRNSWGINCGPRYEQTRATQAGIVIPITILRVPPCSGNRLFAIDDRGRQVLDKDEVIIEAQRRGWDVFLIDPRGIGALQTPGEGFLVGASLLLGENFGWRQATDVRRVIEMHKEAIARNRYHSAFYARGKNATLLAAYLAPLFAVDYPEWIALREPITSIRDMGELPAYATPFNALSLFDVPDLLRAGKTKVIVIEDVEKFVKDPELWQ